MRRVFPFIVPWCLILSGCFGPGEGVEVPQGEIYFPVGVALDAAKPEEAPKHLYVVSSDFDLQYNGGAVQSYDLKTLFEKSVPVPCDADGGLCPAPGASEVCVEGEKPGSERLLYPGRCNPILPEPLSTVKISAFATDALLRYRDDSGVEPRLFIPVRGDQTLHWIDLGENGELECGQTNNGGACDAQHRAGDDPDQENDRDLKLGPEPFGIDADDRAETLVVTNQTSGTASLFVTEDWDAGPQLRFALNSDRIPARPTGIAHVPTSVKDDAAYMMTFRDSAQVRLVRFDADGDSTPRSELLLDAGGVSIDANSVGSDSRGIAIDGNARKAAQARCDADDADCLDSARLVPLDVYVANRAPASLLIGRTRPPEEYPYFFDTVPLTTGPSHVVTGQIPGPSGDLETRVFVVCFDSRRVFVYDPLRGRMEAEIFTGRGPHAVAVDTERKVLYVGHFTDSYVGVYSLDLAFPETYGTLLATLGTPKAPRASK